MKLNALCVGLVALSLGSAVEATDFTLPPTPPSSTLTAGAAYVPPTGSFSDRWSFSIPSLSAASSAVANVSFPGLLNITGLSADLFQWNSTHNSATAISSFFNSSSPSLVTGYGFLSSGDYYIGVSGTASGAYGGAYVLGLNVSPVPEPETYLMMLAGLGVILVVSRRRLKI